MRGAAGEAAIHTIRIAARRPQGREDRFMRITGGTYGGRALQPPKDMRVRPTSDKVRQAIFNILHSRGAVVGASVLDGFCGTGALGLEALSRGALCCIFIDKSRDSLDLCRKNHAALKVAEQSCFLLKDCAKIGPKPPEIAAADLVFLDPPYNQDLVRQALEALAGGGWLAQQAVILVETEKNYDPASLAAMGYDIHLVRDYGDTRIALLQLLQGR